MMGRKVAVMEMSHDQFGSAAVEQRREGKRHRIVLLIGRVSDRLGDSACLVHDISKNGLMARFTRAPAVGDRLAIEVRGLPEVAATVRWVNDYKAGVQFDEEQDLTRVFCLQGEDGLVARTPRFQMRASAELTLGARRFGVELLDISPGGAKLSAEMEVQPGQAGRIMLPETIDPVFGSVCWARDDGRFGLRFATPLPLATLSRVLGCG